MVLGVRVRAFRKQIVKAVAPQIGGREVYRCLSCLVVVASGHSDLRLQVVERFAPWWSRVVSRVCHGGIPLGSDQFLLSCHRLLYAFSRKFVSLRGSF